MAAGWQRILKLVLGWAFLVLGIIGLFVPILQGILFILVGLYLLSHEIPWAARLLKRLKKRYPALNQKLEEVKLKSENWLNRLFKRNRSD